MEAQRRSAEQSSQETVTAQASLKEAKQTVEDLQRALSETEERFAKEKAGWEEAESTLARDLQVSFPCSKRRRLKLQARQQDEAIQKAAMKMKSEQLRATEVG